MARKHIVTCDRCGFEEEIDGVNLKSIRPMAVRLVAVGSTHERFMEAQDMCDDCQSSVLDKLAAIFPKGLKL